MRLIDPSAVAQEDESRVGGKATGLLRIASQFRVPDFVVLVPEAQGDGVVSHFTMNALLRRFNDCQVAVRSSANVEDSTHHAYAGLFLTRLGVRAAEDSLREAIVAVVESVNSKRVQSYAAAVGVDVASIRMSVIIQRMLDPSVSGVTLTQISLEDLYLSIEAVLGIGEPLVAGTADPDRYVYNRATGAVAVSIAHQDHELRLSADGLINQSICAFDRRSQKLSTSQVQELVTECTQLEAHLAIGPLDIEWAYCENTLYILQARPYSALSVRS